MSYEIFFNMIDFNSISYCIVWELGGIVLCCVFLSDPTLLHDSLHSRISLENNMGNHLLIIIIIMW